MNLSLRMPRTSAFAQVSRFMTWHRLHDQDCSETITNFFARAAFANVASLHSFQKPSLLSIGAACAVTAKKSDRTSAMRRIMAFPRALRPECQNVLPVKTHGAVSYS